MIETGYAGLDDLFSRGGMVSMLTTVWLIISAMAFGGVGEDGQESKIDRRKESERCQRQDGQPEGRPGAPAGVHRAGPIAGRPEVRPGGHPDAGSKTIEVTKSITIN